MIFAYDVVIEETILWNCKTLCIFALEFKDPMTAYNNIAKSSFSDVFFSKKTDGDCLSNTDLCARHKRKTTFTFTGKERDRETGFSYFGARYYDSDLTGLFLSVDPMSDKYPSLSPYAYCAWNPVKLVDPDGLDTTYYNVHGAELFKREGGETKKMMVITDIKKLDYDTYKKKGFHTLDIASINLNDWYDAYHYSDITDNENYFYISSNTGNEKRGYKTGDNHGVSEAEFPESASYNVHTHCKRQFDKNGNLKYGVTGIPIASKEKDQKYIGGKFGVILGYLYDDYNGTTGRTFGYADNREPVRVVNFFDKKNRQILPISIRYEKFVETIKKLQK